MPDLYPEIEPYAQGMLEVTGGDLVYWEVCGNPRGKPAVVLHGGPGSGCKPWHRRLFDPAAYRVVLFDQRGCGRSRPHAGSPETELSGNTTGNLIADIELLRVHLNVERWLVLGGSWGSALALAYAERFSTRVTELILFGVTTGRREEFDWSNLAKTSLPSVGTEDDRLCMGPRRGCDKSYAPRHAMVYDLLS